MNAGAFGGEIAKVVTIVHGVTREGCARDLTKDEINFAYRRTNLPAAFVISRVEFELLPGDRDSLRARVMDVRAKRAARQPRGVPNAGSIFKNPPGTFAGRLLEGAGLKGLRVGGAGVFGSACEFYRQSRRRARRRCARPDGAGAEPGQGAKRRLARARSQAGRRLVGRARKWWCGGGAEKRKRGGRMEPTDGGYRPVRFFCFRRDDRIQRAGPRAHAALLEFLLPYSTGIDRAAAPQVRSCSGLREAVRSIERQMGIASAPARQDSRV